MLWRSILFPNRCVSCGKYLSNVYNVKDLICSDCQKGIVMNEPPHCQFCGVRKSDCRCRQHSHAYDAVVAPFYYEGSVKNIIGRMKFGGQEGVSRFLASYLRDEICSQYFGIDFDILTCVPATATSISNRGFNQSRSIAENLNLSTEYFPSLVTDWGLLVKHSGGKMQHSLGAESRRKNIESSFYFGRNRDVAYKKILLIDDILTTGATADACANVLKLNGAKSVFVATAAITRIRDIPNKQKIVKNEELNL